MDKLEIIKNIVDGIDDMILYSENKKAVIAVEDIFNWLDDDEKNIFENEEVLEKLVIEELNKQEYIIDTDDNYEQDTLIVTKNNEE